MDKEALISEILSRPVHIKYSNGFRSERKGGGHGFVLVYLLEHGGKALPGEIGQVMGVSTPRVAVILRELEKRELITRTIMPDDRRKVCVALTEKGRSKAESKQDQQEWFVRRLIEQLSEEDARALPRILDALERVQREHGKRNPHPEHE